MNRLSCRHLRNYNDYVKHKSTSGCDISLFILRYWWSHSVQSLKLHYTLSLTFSCSIMYKIYYKEYYLCIQTDNLPSLHVLYTLYMDVFNGCGIVYNNWSLFCSVTFCIPFRVIDNPWYVAPTQHYTHVQLLILHTHRLVIIILII